MSKKILNTFLVFFIISSLIFVGCKKDDNNSDDEGEIIFNSELTYGSVSDFDGNSYKTIKIGNKTWMAENLKVTHFRNGDSISNIEADIDWASTDTSAYCVYNNNNEYFKSFGLLYNRDAAEDKRNIAPEGWHVANFDDWMDLTTDTEVVGCMLREIGTKHWLNPNDGATNETGFTALPGGKRKATGVFDGIKQYGSWHFGWRLSYNSCAFLEDNYGGVRDGCYIRCVKD